MWRKSTGSSGAIIDQLSDRFMDWVIAWLMAGWLNDWAAEEKQFFVLPFYAIAECEFAGWSIK